MRSNPNLNLSNFAIAITVGRCLVLMDDDIRNSSFKQISSVAYNSPVIV